MTDRIALCVLPQGKCTFRTRDVRGISQVLALSHGGEKPSTFDKAFAQQESKLGALLPVVV